ncbi:hypothetical protein ZOSMA_1G03620 [Zostera marina]|uniref:Glycine-rich protein n=1 Tax=Zostera marina TaxID=29655 RepID=A0A0K9PN35_ZOSMR|nr:hypothetical protein ZOSMA_1G03620 [Zostera marina]
MEYHHTKVLVLAFLCLLAVSTLLATTNAHVVVDTQKGLRKVLNEKTVESEIPSFEDEKYYNRHHGGRHGGGHGGRKHHKGHGCHHC